VSDEFWDKDECSDATPSAAPGRNHGRELTRDEVFVPEVYSGWLGERMRDEAYMQYVAVRRTGWVGKVVVGGFLLLIVLGVLKTVFGL
jgi:hypothetical protein